MLYKDEEFRATDSSIYFKATVKDDVKWLRPIELCSKPLLKRENDPSWPVQGALGNCWLICAFCAVTTSEKSWERIFKSTNNELYGKKYDGNITVQLWVNAEWIEVKIDDRLPVQLDETGQYKLLYGSCNDANSFWVPLLEKACAKLYGCYESLHSGSIAEGYALLTGGYSWSDKLTISSVENILSKMKNIFDKDNSDIFISCSNALTKNKTHKIDSQHNLHCYKVMGIRDNKDAEPSVNLWNPWKIYSFGCNQLEQVSLSNFLKSSPLLTYVTLNPEYVFDQNLKRLSVGWPEKIMRSKWVASESSGGNRSCQTFDQNPQILISVKNEGKSNCVMLVNLIQVSKRDVSERKALEQAIGIHVWKPQEKIASRCTSRQINSLQSFIATKPEYEYVQNVTVLVHAKVAKNENIHFFVIPSTYVKNVNCNFVIRFRCSSEIEEIKHL